MGQKPRWGWYMAGFVGFLLLMCGCSGDASGPLFPFDTSADEDRAMEQELAEGRSELATMEADPCLEDILSGVPEEYSRCKTPTNQPTPTRWLYPTAVPRTVVPVPTKVITPNLEAVRGLQLAMGCPGGCEMNLAGCDIKGNISVDSGEKIYHVPGQRYYDQTKISPEYGERWFCTEAEALDAGWRKAKE